MAGSKSTGRKSARKPKRSQSVASSEAKGKDTEKGNEEQLKECIVPIVVNVDPVSDEWKSMTTNVDEESNVADESADVKGSDEAIAVEAIAKDGPTNGMTTGSSIVELDVDKSESGEIGDVSSSVMKAKSEEKSGDEKDVLATSNVNYGVVLKIIGVKIFKSDSQKVAFTKLIGGLQSLTLSPTSLIVQFSDQKAAEKAIESLKNLNQKEKVETEVVTEHPFDGVPVDSEDDDTDDVKSEEQFFRKPKEVRIHEKDVPYPTSPPSQKIIANLGYMLWTNGKFYEKVIELASDMKLPDPLSTASFESRSDNGNVHQFVKIFAVHRAISMPRHTSTPKLLHEGGRQSGASFDDHGSRNRSNPEAGRYIPRAVNQNNRSSNNGGIPRYNGLATSVFGINNISSGYYNREPPNAVWKSENGAGNRNGDY